MSTSVKEAEAQLKRKEIIGRIDLLCKEQRHSEALPLTRRLVDEFHEERKLWYSLREIRHTEEERQRMMQSDDASTLFLVGYMVYYAHGGARKDYASAYRCFEKASELGHVYATYMRGFMIKLGDGVARDEELGLQLITEAAQRGCGEAAYYAGAQWDDKVQFRQAVHYYALGATLHYSKAQHLLRRLLCKQPLQSCPFGEWKPTRLMHLQVPTKIKIVMLQALLVLRARRDASTWVHRDVAHIILSYVCTKSGWENL